MLIDDLSVGEGTAQLHGRALDENWDGRRDLLMHDKHWYWRGREERRAVGGGDDCREPGGLLEHRPDGSRWQWSLWQLAQGGDARGWKRRTGDWSELRWEWSKARDIWCLGKLRLLGKH